MNKTGLLALAILVVSTTALARNVVLVSHNVRSSSGVLSTLAWKGCPGPTYVAPCVDPNNAWVQAHGITGSTATWDWNPDTGVLTGVGRYEASIFISSNPAGSSILDDKVVDLSIDTGTLVATATSYECVEGTFVAGVGSNACGHYSLGANFVNDSSLAYNVGGAATCVMRTLGGDDSSTGLTRGLTDTAASGGCIDTAGAFNLWNIERDDQVDGGTVIISNGLCLTCAGVSYMTLQYVGGATAGSAAPDSASTTLNTPVNINVLANDSGFADPVTLAISTAPANGTVTITGSPGPKAGIVLTYTPTTGFQGIDTFVYSVSGGTASGIASVSVSVGPPGQPSSAFPVDWPGFQANPAHTGYVPGSLNPSQFVLRWQIPAANGQALNPVAIGDGKVFVSAPSYFGTTGLYAYDEQSGAYLWQVDYSSLFSVNPPAYANGRVYIQTGKGTNSPLPYLRAYDAKTGQLAFQSVFGAQWESYLAPTIVDDVVYVNGGTYGGMYAFSAIDGGQKWFNASLAQVDNWTPAVDANYAYAYLNGTLSVLNRTSGQVAFSITGPASYGRTVPVLGGSNDVIVVMNGQLIRFNTASRTVAWSKSRSFTGQPSVAKGVIYAIDAGALTAWDQVAGTLQWSWAPSGDTLAGPMIVTDTHVLVSGGSKVYAVNLATRTSNWSYSAAGALALAGHSIYIASPTTGNLTSIRIGPRGAYDDSAVAYLSTPTDIDVLKNDDGFSNPTTVSISADPQNGTAAVTGSPGNSSTLRVTYTPADGFQGVDTFQYSASDGVVSGVATVTVDVRTPQANGDATETHLDTAVVADVLKNDVGFSDPVTVNITTSPQHGTALVTGSPGSAGGVRIRYTPAAGFTGNDSLQYQVSNGINTGSATLAISVLPYKAKNDEYYVISNYSDSHAVGTNDIGFQEPVTVTIVSGPTVGSAHVDGSPGSRANVYIHYFAISGSYTDTMTYEISDSTRTDRATVTVHVVPFIAQDDEATTGTGYPVTIDVTQNDIGFNYSRTIGLYTNPMHGSATVSGYGYYGPTIVYVPNPGFLGDDTFQYAIDDGTQVGIATVTVHVLNDTDNDRVDDGVDNCLGLANTDQRDADGDGYGNLCDADFNNDGRVNFGDLAIFRSKFGTADPIADLDGSGVVNFADLARFGALFGKPPGPSARHP